MKVLSRTLVGALALITTTGAWAQVSLMDVYQKALSNDPTLAIQQLNEDNARTQVKSGFSKLLPSMNASATYSANSSCAANVLEDYRVSPDFENCGNAGASIGLEQRVLALAAVEAYESLKSNASKVALETESARQDLIVRVAEAYINVLRARDARDSAQTQLTAVERQYDQTEQRYEVGLVTVTDVMDAQATLDETRVALIDARSQYDIALQNLSVLTGEIPTEVLPLGERLPIETPVEGGQDRWIEYALENHPDILAAMKGLESGEQELNARRNNRLPTVTASASLDYSDPLEDGWDTEERLGSSVALTVSLPLYTGGATTAEIVSTGIQNNIAEQQLELLKRNISVQVGNLYRQVRTDAQNIAAQQQVVKSRESALQATEVGYEVGTRNIVEVLNAQQAVFAARQAYANARYDYVIDRLKLKQAAGQLTEDDLNAIESFLILN